MIIQSFPSGPIATNCYVIACQKTKQAAVIDPAYESFKIVENFLNTENLHLEKILLTHSHWDHIADCSLFKEKFKVPVFIHEKDLPNLETPGSDRLLCRIPIKPVKADGLLSNGDTVTVGEIQLLVIHTPGHSPGSICFYAKEQNLLLSGDTLFKGSFGTLALPTANPTSMWSSLDKLAKLPPETLVYSGHGPATTIGSEKWLPRAEELFAHEYKKK